MSALSFAQSQAAEQRRRLVGSLMDHLEKQVYPHLPTDVRTQLRGKVLQAAGQYHDWVLDALKAAMAEEDPGRNELAVEAALNRLADEIALLRAQEA